MATFDQLLTEVEQNLNRNQWFDASGANITTAYLSSLLNKAIHQLERLFLTPLQTFTYQLQLVAQQQVYPLQSAGTTLAYRGTRGITIPNQVALTANVGMNGWRVNYLPHEQARVKYQLVPQNQVLPGPPYDYSIFSSPQQLSGPAMFSGTPSGTGGALPAGTYFWTLTAIVNGVETLCATEYTTTLTGATSKVQFTWTAYANALLTGYNLYRGTGSGLENVFYTLPSSATSFTDTGAAAPFGSPLVPPGGGTPVPAYWVWPVPNQAYFANVDQDVFLPDLVAGLGQTNWFTVYAPDALVYDATLKAAASLKDQTAMAVYGPLREQAWEAAASAMSGLQFSEETAQSVEMG